MKATAVITFDTRTDVKTIDVRKYDGRWLGEHDKTCPLHPRKAPTAIGGRITFCFTPPDLVW